MDMGFAGEIAPPAFDSLASMESCGSAALDANGHQGRRRSRLLGARPKSNPGPKGARDGRGAIDASEVGAKSTRSIAMLAPEATAGSDEHRIARARDDLSRCWGQSSYALCSGFTNEHSGRKIEVVDTAGAPVGASGWPK